MIFQKFCDKFCISGYNIGDKSLILLKLILYPHAIVSGLDVDSKKDKDGEEGNMRREVERKSALFCVC